MSQPKTDYNPDNYNRNSLANIMQFITADLLIEHDIEGTEAFAEFHPNIVKIRQKIVHAYQEHRSKKYADVSVANIAEGVLLWLREDATIEDVLKAHPKSLVERGATCVIK